MALSALVKIGEGKTAEVLCRQCAEDRGYSKFEWTAYTLEDYVNTIDEDDHGKLVAGPDKCQDCGLVEVSL
jgi:hypothetical protein